MSLPVLAALVLGGVSLVALVTHLTGGSTTASLASDEEAARIWALEHDASVSDVQRTDDDHAALLALEGGGTGVVYALGDRWVCRPLGPGSLLRVRERGDRLVLVTRDFAAPAVRLQLADPATRTAWQRRLES